MVMVVNAPDPPGFLGGPPNCQAIAGQMASVHDILMVVEIEVLVETNSAGLKIALLKIRCRKNADQNYTRREDT